MSRRYGRKQRREARATIEKLENHTIFFTDALIREARRRREAQDQRDFLVDRIRLWDSEIRALLGPYTSFAIDAPTYRVDHPDQIRQMPVIPPMRTFWSVDSHVGMATMQQHIERMLIFMVDFDEDVLIQMRRYLSIRLQIGSERVNEACYACSESTWKALTLDPQGPGMERTIERMTRDMIRLLAAPKPKKKPSGDDLVPEMDRQSRRL